MAWMLFYSQVKSVYRVCMKFGISRKTFYKWWNRYVASGFRQESLFDHSRKPHRSPRATPTEVVEKILEAREATGFGPRKLKLYLESSTGIVLSEHTIWKVLKRHFLEETSSKEQLPKYNNRKRNGNGNGKHVLKPGEVVKIFHFDVTNYLRLPACTEYTAIDVATHLRISKIYEGHSMANSSDFLKFVLKKFPFDIQHVHTVDDSVYTRRSVAIGDPTPVTELFPMLLLRHDIRHSLLTNEHSDDSLASSIQAIDTKEFFEKNFFRKTKELLGEFEQFIVFYNNHRHNEALNGLTPLQALKSFDDFRHLLYFDPFV